MFNPIASSSANKEKIVNENFLFQEAFNFGVIDRSLSSPPVNPSSQGVYIPAATATGAWAGRENQIFWWNPDGYWRRVAPKEGMKIFSQVLGEIGVKYSAGSWQAIAITSGGGGSANLGILGDEARNLVIRSATETEPFVGVDEGTAVIVGTGATATGDWAGLEGQYVRYENGNWVAYPDVKTGTVVYCYTDEKFYYFSQFGSWYEFTTPTIYYQYLTQGGANWNELWTDYSNIYRFVVEFNDVPNNGVFNIVGSISLVNTIVKTTLVFKDATGTYTGNYYDGIADNQILYRLNSDNDIELNIGTARSGTNSGHIIVEYTVQQF